MTFDNITFLIIGILLFSVIMFFVHIFTRDAPRSSIFLIGIALFFCGMYLGKGYEISRLRLLASGVIQVSGTALGILGFFKLFIPESRKKENCQSGAEPVAPMVRCPYCAAVVLPCVDGSCPKCKVDGLPVPIQKEEE